MPREFKRSDRLGAQIQRELAEILRSMPRDARLGMITVSAVELSKDLSVAKAFVTFLGAEESPQACVRLLNKELTPNLRHDLARRIRVRVLPDLRFVHDESLEKGLRIDQLLHSLNNNRPAESE